MEEQISKLLGKPVISIYNGTLEGYIKNALLDKKMNKLLWLEIFDDDSQEEKLVEAKYVYCLLNDAVMLKNSDGIYVAETTMFEGINPIGCKVYDINGTFAGKITDVTFDERLFVDKILLQDEMTLEKRDILVANGNIAIKKTTENIKISNFKPRTKIFDMNINEQIVEIQNESKASKSPLPKKIPAGYEFLIGRKVGQNIYADNKQIIVKKQSKITSQIIDVASRNGKLKELTSLSLA